MQTKVKMPELAPEIRVKNFEEVALGYSPEDAAREAGRCLECKNAPCRAGCPVGVDIPRFIAEIKRGEAENAHRVIRETNSLPAVCGRVCPQESQCEKLCVRGIKGESVAIGRLERFASETAVAPEPPKARIPFKAAVIGSGPAGLSCAGELARNGASVTVFEGLHKLGGVLAYGIPEFRLPRRVTEREIDNLRALGVEFVTNCVVGGSVTIDELLKDGYDMVFAGSGAGLPSFLGIPGENLGGVYSANEFLTRVNLMKAYEPNAFTPLPDISEVVVVGGGNVAMDAARCARRLGANVTIVYRRGIEELPARLEEVHHAGEEGVVFKTLSNPVEIRGENAVTSMLCAETELGGPDESGRRKPRDTGRRFEIPCDCVIVATGSSPNPLLRGEPGLDFDGRGRIVADDCGRTSLSRVWAGGDAVTGAATVILAMGAGKMAAVDGLRLTVDSL